MRQTREARGTTLREIANRTKISVSALEALERNDISRLPGGIFSRAFVRAYAVEIGLDPEQTIREFLTQFPHNSVTQGSPHVPQEDHAAIESSRRSAETAVKLVAISLPVAGVILYLTLTYPAPAGVAPNPPSTTAQAVAPTDAPAPPDVALPMATEPLTFEIVAMSLVSVDVDIDGTRRESRAFGAGDRLVVHADREMTLRMSDAGAVQLTINGQRAVALGDKGEGKTLSIGRANYGAFLASP